MTKQTIELDMRRGMAAQKATELRRLMSEVAANEKLLHSRQKELEEQLLASPSIPGRRPRTRRAICSRYSQARRPPRIRGGKC